MDDADDEMYRYLQTLIGRASHAPVDARDPVTTSAIRTWCDAMRETDPAFVPPSEFAPPAMLQLWTMPGLEAGRPLDAGPARSGDLDENVRGVLASHGYSGTLAAVTDQTFAAPVRVGELIAARDEYTAVTTRKQTALGPGYFLSARTTYTGSGGRLVGELDATVFHFAPRASGTLPAPLPPRAAADPPAPIVPAGVLSEGAHLEAVIPVTTTMIVAGALATRDFYPVHHDRDFARARGNRDLLMNIMTINGLLGRVVGEWTGHLPLLRLRTRLRAPIHPGEDLRLSARVGARTVNHAELEISLTGTSGPLVDVRAWVGSVDVTGGP